MSLGYIGLCKKILEDEQVVIYSYAGENWNDGGKSKTGDVHLQDGMITIYKDCLEQVDVHRHIKKTPSGRKKTIEKRIVTIPSLDDYIKSERIVIDQECKNAFRCGSMKVDYIAYRLLLHIFKRYQTGDELPDEERFIQ